MKIRKSIFCSILVIILILVITYLKLTNNITKIPTSFSNVEKLDNTKFNKSILETSNRDIIPGTENLKGIRYRIYNEEGIIDNKFQYYLSKGQAWNKFISISNNLDSSCTYKLTLFIDYKQSKFKVDANVVQDFTFKLQQNETLEYPLALKI